MLSALTEFKDCYYVASTAALFIYPLGLLLWTTLESGRERSKPEQVADRSQKSRQRTPRCAQGLAAAWRRLTLAEVTARRVGIGFAYFVQTIVNFVRLGTFALLLAPWFIWIAVAYAWDQRIRRGLRFGPNARNYVDVSVPSTELPDGGFPVAVLVMGGAWLIGHRWWNAHLAMRLADAGILCIAVDYRNYPFAQMHEMVEDVGNALDWVFASVAYFGGDLKSVSIVSQSAGAHLAAQMLVERAAEAQQARRPSRTWAPKNLKGFVGVSGVYDLNALDASLRRRWVYSLLPQACPAGDLGRFSPARFAEGAGGLQLPPFRLFHGAEDRSVPAASSEAFAAAVRRAGAKEVVLEVREGMRHAEPVVDDPLTGGDLQPRLLLSMLLGAKQADQRLRALPPPRPQAPSRWVAFASAVMPF